MCTIFQNEDEIYKALFCPICMEVFDEPVQVKFYCKIQIMNPTNELKTITYRTKTSMLFVNHVFTNGLKTTTIANWTEKNWTSLIFKYQEHSEN